MDDVLLQVKDLSVSFAMNGQYYKALREVSFELKRGETLALLGESGCGKSLTSLAIMQLLPPNAWMHKHGSIRLEGQSLEQLPLKAMRKIRGSRIAMIFQEPMTSLNPVLTVGQQLAEAVNKEESLKGEALKKRLVELMQKVEMPHPERQLNDYPHQLSGGQKQRVMIAMAIACKPDLLIADEPTTALDVTIQAQILSLLGELQRELDMAMLLITHDLSIVKEVSSRIAVMYAGEIVEQNQTEAFFKSPLHPYSQRLLGCLPSISKRHYRLANIEGMVPQITDTVLGCRFKDRCQHVFSACDAKTHLMTLENEKVVRCFLYDDNPETLQSLTPTLDKVNLVTESDETLLEVKNLKVHYPVYQGLLKRQVDVVKAVDGVSFSIAKGETVALVGESGCGKTTLTKAILELIPKTSGDVYLHGQALKAGSKKLRQSLQVIFQDPFSSMNPRMLIGDIITEAFIAQRPTMTSAERDKAAGALLNQVGLPKDSKKRYPHQFSGGQRQRICIARALALNPELVICDEPTSALDVSVQAQILNLLRELQAELNVSFLFISHDIAVVSYLAKRVLVMQAGKLVEIGETESLLANPQNDYTKTLLSAANAVEIC